MQLIYNSDLFTVLQIDWADGPVPQVDGQTLPRAGLEIVDKQARTGIFIEGALAEQFREGVQALAEHEPDVDELDAYIHGFTGLAPQPMVLH